MVVQLLELSGKALTAQGRRAEKLATQLLTEGCYGAECPCAIPHACALPRVEQFN